MPAQGRLAVKSASRVPLPDLDCLVPTAADKHGSVGAPRNRRDNTMKYSTVSRITRLFTRMGNFLEKITLSARSPGSQGLARNLHLHPHRSVGTCSLDYPPSGPSGATRVLLVFVHQRAGSHLSRQLQ